MRRLEYTVPAADAGRHLGAVLEKRLLLSRHSVSSLKFSGGILLDGAPAHTGRTVQAGQVVAVVLEDPQTALEPFPLPLSVPYRDGDLLVVDKPAPLPSIRGARSDAQTLENAVYAFLGCPERFVYRPVSRLDKGTSGLMPVALNAHMHDRMQRLLHTQDYARVYLAVTEGAPASAEGVCALPIGRAEGVRRCIDPHGRPAATHYRVLEKAPNGRALIRLRLETGRTHQIRVHLAAMGCPVAGDYLYGAALPGLNGRFALHAAELAFLHPLTGERLSFSSPLPPPLRALLTE